MIPLWPYQKLDFESSRTRAEIIDRLTREVAEPGWSWGIFEQRTSLFQGTVSEEGIIINESSSKDLRNKKRPPREGAEAS
jgi:hypothetical protein